MKKIKGKRNIDMISGPIIKNIVAFGVPIALMTILQHLYNTADTIIVGRFAGQESLAAVGSTSSLTALLINMFLGFSVGASVVVSQKYGANDYDGVKRAVHSTMALAIVSGVVLILIGIFATRPLLILMNTPKEILDKASLYMKVVFYGMPAGMMYNCICGILRAVGKTKFPLVVSLISGIINVILNIVFVCFLEIDVLGVALATAISSYFTVVAGILYITREEGPIRLVLKDIKFHKEILNVFKIGVPTGINGALYSISNVIIQSTINGFGAVAVAGAAAASSLETFEYAAFNAFSQGSMSFIAQNYGAKNYKRFNKIIYGSILVITIVSAMFVSILIPFGKPLLSIYSTDSDVINFGFVKLIFVAGFYFLCGYNEVFQGALRGIGRATTTMILAVIGISGVRIIWVLTAVKSIKTPEMLYFSYPLSWLVATIFNMIAFYIILNKIKKKEMV